MITDDDWDWKSFMEEQVEKLFNGVSLRWTDDNPTIIIPDDYPVSNEDVMNGISSLWELYGGEVVFHPEQIAHTDD